MTSRKILLAALAVGSLTLVACGSDEDDQSSKRTSSSSSAATTTASKAPEDADKPGEDNKDRKDGQDPARDGEAQPGEDSNNPEAGRQAAQGDSAPGERAGRIGQAPPPAVPVSGPSTEEDKAAIANVVLTLGQGSKNAADYANALLDNSCRAYIDRRGGEEAARRAANATRDAGAFGDIGDVPTINSVDNITVNGDRATATVNGRDRQGAFSQNMEFAREDGAWLICPSA